MIAGSGKSICFAQIQEHLFNVSGFGTEENDTVYKIDGVDECVKIKLTKKETINLYFTNQSYTSCFLMDGKESNAKQNDLNPLYNKKDITKAPQGRSSKQHDMILKLNKQKKR